MAKRRVTRCRTMQATRQIGAYLALMVVQQDDDTGDMLVSLMPMPYGFAMLTTWLATLWLAIAPVVSRVWLEAGWLWDDALRWLQTPAWLHAPVGFDFLNVVQVLAMRFYVAVSVLDIAARTLWWAAR